MYTASYERARSPRPASQALFVFKSKKKQADSFRKQLKPHTTTAPREHVGDVRSPTHLYLTPSRAKPRCVGGSSSLVRGVCVSWYLAMSQVCFAL